MAKTSLTSYVDAALNILRENSIYSGNVSDWESLSVSSKDRAQKASSLDDAHMIVKDAIKALGNKHTFLVTSQDLRARRKNPNPPLPTGEIIDGIAYLNIPSHEPSEKLPGFAYADRIQCFIAEFDTQNPMGWCVDLRKNCGGNMWPMIAGLGPLLGEEILGYFKNPKYPANGRYSYSYRDGASWGNGTDENARISSEPYNSNHAHAPIAVLTGPMTASSGEAVAIGFIGNPNARSFGEPTAGFSTCNQHFPLADGSWLVVTTGVFADRFDRDYGIPVTPDEPMLEASPKAVFARATSWIKEQAHRPTAKKPPLSPQPR